MTGQASETNYQTLLNEGIARGTHGDYLGAIERLCEAVKLRPQQADGYFNLGVALRGEQRISEAISAFERSVELRPDWPEANFNLGNGYRDIDQRDRAIEALERAIKSRPGYVKALNNLGNLYFDQGNLLRAETLLRRALESRRDYPEGLFNLGRVLRRQRKHRDALDVTTKAVALQPANTRYLLRQAELQKLLGQVSSAAETLEAVRKLDSDNPDAIVQTANLLKDHGKADEALALLSGVIVRGKATSEVLCLRAEIRRSKGQLELALQDLQLAIQREPSSAAALNLQGVVLFALGEPQKAIASYRSAIALRPDLVEPYNNLGAALQSLRQFADSRMAFDTAIRLKPDFSVARLNRSLSLLRNGELTEGWREFEWRFLCPDYRLTYSNRPLWMGESLAGRTILLRCEQGLGDTFQFIRYAKLVKERGAAQVIVECQDAACELVSRAPGVDRVVKRGAPLPRIDVQIPLMSLPNLFPLPLENLPSEVPYLSASAESMEQWHTRLRPLAQLLVAISWQGNPKFQADNLRSFSLANFQALSQIPNVALISVQKNEGLSQLPAHPECKVHHFSDELDKSGAFVDTAAILTACDLVITSDTAVAHLAGALGRPTWLALSYSADWRWLADRDDCPWYPTMRLFRQSTFKDWNAVFEQMAAELRRVQAGEPDLLLPPYIGGGLREIRIETAPGDLVDKLTILQIKAERIRDLTKLAHVVRELASLRTAYTEILPRSEAIERLAAELTNVNRRLWDIEDQIRDCEATGDFGSRFIELARSVYKTNDQRALLKREINQLLKARFQEEKLYGGSH